MRILTDPIKIAVAFFSSTGVNIVLLTLEPICPPINTVTSRMDVSIQST